MTEQQHHKVIVIGAGGSGIYQIKRLADLELDALLLEGDEDWVARGIAIATPVVDSIRKAIPTGILFQKSCWMNGTGKSDFLPNLKTSGISSHVHHLVLRANETSSKLREQIFLVRPNLR